MARYNKTPKGMQLQKQTPGEGGRGGIATLPNPKPMPQVDPHQQDYANWYQQVTGQGYTPMYRSPLDGKPYQVDANGLRTAVDEQTFQTVYPSELGNTGGSQWGGPQSKTLQPAEWNVPQGQWARPMQEIQQPQQQLAMGGDGGMNGGYTLPQQGAMLGGPAGVPGGVMQMGGGNMGILQDPQMQQEMSQFFKRNMSGTNYAMAQQSSLNDAMADQSVRDMRYGTGWGGAIGGLASFFTGDPGYSQYAEKQMDNAYKRRQELAGNTNNLVNNSQQNMMNAFNMLMQSDPQSIKNQAAMANAMAAMSRAQSYGQSVSNSQQLGQGRLGLGYAQLGQRDQQFRQTMQMRQQELQMNLQRVQFEGARLGQNQQQIDLQKQRLMQDYQMGMQRLAQDAQSTQYAHQDRQMGIQQDYDQMDDQNQRFWAGEQNRGYAQANEQGYDSNTQQPYYKYSPQYRQQYQTRAQAPGSAGGASQLDMATAQRFLQQAGGDKAKARQLAAQAGYKF